MSNTNLEDVIVQLTETRNELSEEGLRLWDGLENERVSRIAGDDANKSLTLQVQDSVSGTERRLSTEVIHREQGDLDKLGLLNQLSQSMSAYRIKTDKEIEAERFARDILGINLDARITTAEASFNHKELKLYQDIQEVFTDLDGKYTSMDARIKKYEDMLQDITMDSIKITMDNGEINMGAWTILSQAREWDLEILAKMRGFQEKTNEDVNQALEELQNQLPITENIINEIMENLSESPLISELRDALNESIDTSESLELKLAREAAARAQAMIDLAYANAQALAAEKAALAETLAAEAQARADEVQEEADRRIESIRQIRADLEQDVGELNDQVDSIRDGAIADKAGILETVNNYKTELKSDIATVNTELLGALDGVNTLVTEVRNGNEVTLNELTTYKTSNDVAVAGLLSKVTTNISNTAANASKITGLTSGLATTNTELGTVRNTSANALSKANTAVTANSALATRVDALAASITDLGEGAETSVDVYAFNALKAEVGTNAAGVSSLVEQVNALGTNYTNLADGVQANTDAVSTLTVKQSEMNGDISQLSSDVTYLTSELGVTNTALNTKASNQALSNLNTKLTTTDGLVAANTQQLTQLNSDLTTVKNGLETKASTEALNDLATEVIELEDGLAVNASAITSLKSEIDTELDKKATVTAVNGLTTKVEEVEGKTTTNANNLLALNTTVGNVVNGLANKLDASAISDYYTKSQADDKAAEVAAGKVEEFNANLIIGGVNQLANSEAARTNEAAVRREHLMYEQSAHLKHFYDDNLGKDITISFEIMVPVAGVVRAYAQNNSAHAFDVETPWLVANTWTKVTVSVVPTKRPDYATQVNSTLEFYGVYDTGRIPTVRKVQLEAGNKATAWSPSPRDTQAALDANSTAIQNTSAEVSRVDDRVTATNSAQTLLEGRVEDVEGDITKKADASALSSLDTRVGTVEGQYTTQASDITRLNNSLDTTNVNVGTAQTAAQNAMNAAGAKGKVIFGITAPAVADRLVQNLWIDTTSNANTPKRWNGSAWVAVTDKVALDAANAVNTLDAAVKTKADVSALNSLTTKVNDEADKTTANTASITELNSDIDKINEDIATKADASALSSLTTRVESEEGKSTSQGSAITALQNTVNHATTGLATKASSGALTAVDNKVTAANGRIDTTNSNVTKLTGRVDTVEGDIIKKADASALSSLATRVTEEEGKSTSQGTAITALQNSVNHATTGLSTKASSAALTVVDNKVTAVDGRVTATNSNVTSLTGRVDTVEGNLTTKADVSAVNSLTTRVGDVEGGLSTQASDITSLKSSIAGTAESVTANGSQATLDTIGLPSANVLLAVNASSMTGNLIKLRGQISSPVTNIKMLIDPTKLYKLRTRYRRTAGANNPIYIAVINYNAVGNQTVTSTNGLNPEGTTISNAIYPISFEIPAINQWREVEYYFKGKSTGASTGSGTLDSPRTFPALAASVDIGVLANYQMGINNLTQEYEIDYLIFEDATSEAANAVNASAISTTNTEVERVDKTVSGHTQQLSNLNASIAGKANTSALDALTVRVTEEEKKSTSQATSITNLNSSLTTIQRDNLLTEFLDATGGGAIYRQVSIPLKKNTYIAKGRKITVKGKLSFKHTGTLTASQGLLIFLGGNITFNVNDPIKQGDDYYFNIMVEAGRDLTFDTLNFYCYPEGTANASTQTTVHWAELYFGDQTSKVDLSGKADASAVSTLTTQVEDIDGLVTTQAEQLLVLTSDNNDNKNALSVQAKVIDGVKANYMVKMETNGVIGGFGLMQTTGALGQVQTSFGVNADSFFIGAPASRKQPFIVTTTNQVVNGVTYPAGTYIDVALIANATIGNAHIADASITNAKIKDLDASKITTGTLDAKRIRVGSTSQFDTGYAPTDVLNNAKTYVDNLEIGGRNLIKNSSMTSGKGWAANGRATISHSSLYTFVTIAENTSTPGIASVEDHSIDAGEYTLSGYFATGWVPTVFYIIQSGLPTFSIELKGMPTNLAYYKSTFKIPRSYDNCKIYFLTNGTLAGQKLYLKNIKLEKGNKATDWTPAPEDVDAAIESKSKTFTAQPTTPYTSGDLWRNGSTIRVCTVTRASGSYVAADWTLVGDVTSANTAANSNQLGGKASATVLSDITNAKNAADTANSQVVLWKYGNTTYIDGGKIYANSVTANQISTAAIDTIALKARNGTFTAADGSKTVINGGLTEVYYPNGKIAIRLGVK